GFWLVKLYIIYYEKNMRNNEKLKIPYFGHIQVYFDIINRYYEIFFKYKLDFFKKLLNIREVTFFDKLV
ncbi:hypothetical protein, partial [Campylobacter californiensis]|uniref:hypothetical protein n=1 Tax=Campylobacter californiensis TaxID=1032243 RepID=UPI001D15D5E8